MKQLVLPLLLVALLSFAFLHWAFSQRRVRLVPVKPPVTTGPEAPDERGKEADAEEQVRLAQEAMRGGRFQEVVDRLRIVQGRGDPQVEILLAEGYSGLGQDASAAACLEQATAKKREPDVLLKLGTLYLRLGRKAPAMKTFQELGQAKTVPETREKILIGWAAAASETLDYPASLGILKKALREFPANEAGVFGILKLLPLLPVKEIPGEIKELREKGDQAFGERYEYQLGLGNAFLRAGEKTAASECLRKASSLKPAEMLPHALLYRLAREAGSIPQALEELDAILRTLPVDGGPPMKPEGLFLAAIEARKNARLDLAFRFLRGSVLRDKALLGRDDQGTVAAVAEYLKGHGTEEEKTFMTAFLAYFNGDHKETRKILEGAAARFQDPFLKRDGENLLATCRKILANEAAYRTAQAEQEEARRLARQASEAAAIKQKPASVASGSADQKAAKIAEIKATAASHSGDAAYQYEAGRKLHALGDLAGAKAAFQAALAVSPGLWEAYHCLGLITLQEKKYGESAAFIEKAVKLAPTQAFLVALHGSIKLQMGDVATALESSKKALELNPQCGQAHLTLADIYNRSKRDEDALAEVNKGLAGESDPRMIQRLQAMKKVILGE